MTKARRRGRSNANESNATERKTKEETAATSAGSLTLLRRALTITGVTVGLIVGVGLNICPFKALPIDDEFPPFPMEDPVFAFNQKLTEGIKLDDLPGAESVVEDASGNLYSGLDDGRIVRIAPSGDGELGGGKIETIFIMDLPGAYKTMPEAKHGRPLGLRLWGNTLYICDAVYGIVSLDLVTKRHEILVAPKDATPPMAFPNDLAFSRKGKYLYITDMSSTYAIDSLLYSALSGECDGRVLRLNMATKKLSTVVSGLCSGNGVEVTNDGDFILISETMRSRVRMVETSTFKTRKLIYLPASPDNIRRNSKGTYWVGASHPRTAAADFIRKHRFLRQLIGGFISLKNIAKTINKKSNMVFEVDRMGDVLQTLHDVNGTLTNGLAQAVELSDGRLALTTYSANFLAILNENDSKPIGDVKHV